MQKYKRMSVEDIYIAVMSYSSIGDGRSAIGISKTVWKRVKYLFLNEVAICRDESIYGAYVRATGEVNKSTNLDFMPKCDNALGNLLLEKLSHHVRVLINWGYHNPELWLRNYNKPNYGIKNRTKAILFHSAMMGAGSKNNYFALRGLEADLEHIGKRRLREDEIQLFLKGIYRV